MPRGGSSFLNELDGNLCCVFDRETAIVTLSPDQNKWRGERFIDIKFKADFPPHIQDRKGRQIGVPIFTPIDSGLENVHNQLNEFACNKAIDDSIQNAEFDEFMFNHIGELVKRGKYPSESNLSRKHGLKEVKRLWTATKVCLLYTSDAADE